MDLEFDLSLKRLSTTATALALWNQPDIKSKLKHYFCAGQRFGKRNYLTQLIKEVMMKLDRNVIPPMLYSELMYIVKELGLKIGDWQRFIRRKSIFRDIPLRELFDLCANEIVWTYYGSIDEIKTVKSWLENPNFDVVKKYYMACYYCFEDKIKLLWKIVSKKKNFYDENKLNSTYGLHLVAYWNRIQNNNNFESFVRDIKIQSKDGDRVYDENRSAEVNMFRLSVRKGYVEASKYFWNKMNSEEKKRDLEFNFELGAYIAGWKNSAEHYRKE